MLVKSFGSDPQAIFAGDPHVEVNCPRCGGIFKVTPDMVTQFIEALEKDERARGDG